MTSLVTGATGFIGRNLVAQLANQGDQVRALYRNEQRARQLLDNKIERVLGECCDRQAIRQAVDGVDVVYHCTAAHSTCPDEEIRRTNVPSVRYLLEAIREAGTRPRVILLSSLNVLGNGSLAVATEETPRRRTNDVHVDEKIAAEELAEEWIADGRDIVLLRPGLVYGPGDPHLPKLARAVARGKFVFIGSRDNIVPLVHISDAVQALKLAARASGAAGRTYNITDGTKTTIGSLVAELARVLGCQEPKRVLPSVVPRVANSVCGLVGRPGPVSPSALRFLGSSRFVDIRRARAELGFEPRIRVAEGVETMRTLLREVDKEGVAA